MKNKLIIIFFLKLFFFPAIADNLKIESKKISIDKNKEVTIFENQVMVITKDNNKIESNFAKLNKRTKDLILKDNVKLEDANQNFIETNHAEYNETSRIFESKGVTKVTTSENYIINGKNIIFDNKNKIISSNDGAVLTDSLNNEIYLENFKYDSSTHIFKSIGLIKIKDNLNNTYEFSQIYIDTKKKEIAGTDIKAYLNQDDFKLHEKNKPRIFANAIKLENNGKCSFHKNNFTLCDYRENDKCPPWEIRSSKMLHDNKKKTIYYKNALIKVYNVPIFYIPRLSHPDPTVDRRSGFLPPSYSDTKNLGEGISLPYFFNMGVDKNFTLTNRLYLKENPLFLGDYHQVFKNSFLLANFGYTAGYKNTSIQKKAGEKSHFFSKYTKNFIGKNNSKNLIELNVQEVSNDKYLKLYKIKSNLVDFNSGTIENSIDFTRENENSFFGINASLYETLNDDYNDKYEYFFPEITFDKNLLSDEKFGRLDYQSNIEIHNYDTNKTNKFLVNDFNWNYKDLISSLGITNKIFGHVRNINYESKNVDLYKDDPTSEIFGSAGLLSSINLEKNINRSIHAFTPKVFLRYGSGSMRQETTGSRLDPLTAFSMDRLNNIRNLETGFNTAVGFDYSIIKNDYKKFDFSVAQIINSKENKMMSSESSMDEKLSDLVGSMSYSSDSGKTSLAYNFNVDQNYKELNYNELSASYILDPFKINFDYLKEQKHLGDQEYLRTKLDLFNNKSNQFSFSNKRNLVTNSSEFYNLSYEYVNDCLRAGLVYRREFYNDSEIEPENSLMFKITLSPFGDVFAPSFKN